MCIFFKKIFVLDACPQLSLPHRIFKANENLNNITIDSVTCDCLPPAGPEERKHCKNETGHNMRVDRFRQDNCYQIQDGNRTDVTTPVFLQFTLDCGVDQDTFENFIWIKPMGAIQFQSTVGIFLFFFRYFILFLFFSMIIFFPSCNSIFQQFFNPMNLFK